MKTELIRIEQDKWLPAALDVLEGGGLVAFPTDTVYGLGVKAQLKESVARLFEVKERFRSKPIPVLFDKSELLGAIVEEVPPMAQIFSKKFWPGPLTMVLRRRPGLEFLGGEDDTVGVRMPDHPITLRLLDGAGPLAVTSANLSGARNAITAKEVHDQLSARIDLIIDGGRIPGGEPSTIVDCTGDSPKILRKGPISQKDLLHAFLS